MPSFMTSTRAIAAALLSGFLLAGSAWADKPDNVGKERGANKARKEQVTRVEHFSDQHRLVVRDYYGAQIQSGRCPPGLAKKNNGCQPPGQAKKWALGQPLPRDVVYHPVPAAVIARIGVPPTGYKYVRVATDILLIAIGTAMVVDAIQDLGR